MIGSISYCVIKDILIMLKIVDYFSGKTVINQRKIPQKYSHLMELMSHLYRSEPQILLRVNGEIIDGDTSFRFDVLLRKPLKINQELPTEKIIVVHPKTLKESCVSKIKNAPSKSVQEPFLYGQNFDKKLDEKATKRFKDTILLIKKLQSDYKLLQQQQSEFLHQIDLFQEDTLNHVIQQQENLLAILSHIRISSQMTGKWIIQLKDMLDESYSTQHDNPDIITLQSIFKEVSRKITHFQMYVRSSLMMLQQDFDETNKEVFKLVHQAFATKIRSFADQNTKDHQETIEIFEKFSKIPSEETSCYLNQKISANQQQILLQQNKINTYRAKFSQGSKKTRQVYDKNVLKLSECFAFYGKIKLEIPKLQEFYLKQKRSFYQLTADTRFNSSRIKDKVSILLEKYLPQLPQHQRYEITKGLSYELQVIIEEQIKANKHESSEYHSIRSEEHCDPYKHI